MQKIWKKSEPAQQNKVVGCSSSPRSPEVKFVRKPACWGASRATGEAEVIYPPADKIKAARPECTPQPAIPDSAKVKSWNPFTKDKDPPAAGANAAQQAHTHRQGGAPARDTYFSSIPILGRPASAASSKQADPVEEKQISTGDQISNYAGRMGDIVVRSMAGGFGVTLGRRAAHSLWNGMTSRR
ncbi:hypothetical protein ABBQ38_015426 [Trebouxia sp. C0009 RCD-2024]